MNLTEDAHAGQVWIQSRERIISVGTVTFLLFRDNRLNESMKENIE